MEGVGGVGCGGGVAVWRGGEGMAGGDRRLKTVSHKAQMIFN